MAGEMNGKITNVEMEMMIDDMSEKLPYLIESAKMSAEVLKAKYDSLITAGFTPEQSLDIIKIRPLYE